MDDYVIKYAEDYDLSTQDGYVDLLTDFCEATAESAVASIPALPRKVLELLFALALDGLSLAANKLDEAGLI